jgi:signal peptide peptidase SppA
MNWLHDLLRPYVAKPWPMEPHALMQLFSAEGVAGSIQAARPTTKVKGAVAVIPLEGVIFPDVADAFASSVLSAANDPSIGAIVLAVDSPGGVITGVPEAADAIYSVRRSKPMVTVTTGINASAAYWLSSAAPTIISAPSGDTGSIGVWTAHLDASKLLDSMGLKVSLVSAGKYKVEGNMFEPLTDEARSHLQEGVDDAYSQFVKAVARNRGASASAVREGYGEGRVLNGERAQKAGLVDRVATMGTVLSELQPQQGRSAKALLKRLDLDAA